MTDKLTSAAEKSVRLLLIVASLLLPAYTITTLTAAESQVIGDTYVSAAASGSSFGASTALMVASGNSALLQFDLTGYLPTQTVSSAYLRIFVNRVTLPGTLTFTQVTSPWIESTVTASNRPSLAGGPFASASATLAGQYIVVDATTLVQNWIANPAANFGVQTDAASGTASVLLDSKESTATSHPAILDITLVAAAGPTGVRGTTGPVGPSGPVGNAGARGPTGQTGPAGPMGTTGVAGLAGAQGAVGAAGPVGSRGPTGLAGTVGPGGSAGARGLTGPQGPVGPTGATGNAGSAGSQGPVGVAGPQGPSGLTGSVGPAGAVGPTGAQGGAGAVGPLGSRGATGPTGSIGNAGSAGSAGSDGTAGPRGGNGPNGNVFAMGITLRSSGYTIPDIDSSLVYVMNNASGPVTLNLPHATMAGRKLIAMVKFHSTSNKPGGGEPGGGPVGSTQLTVVAQVGNTIVSNVSATSLAVPRIVELICDGAGQWSVLSQK